MKWPAWRDGLSFSSGWVRLWRVTETTLGTTADQATCSVRFTCSIWQSSANSPTDYILDHPAVQAQSVIIVPLPVLWNILLNGLSGIWPPSRTAINGVSLGDAWPCSSMPQPAQSPTSPTFSPFPNTTGQANGVAPWESILPFHKLTQWLTYSLMQPMQSIMKIYFAGQELLTGLPEYRNGGLFVDMGVLTLKKEDEERGLEHYTRYCERTGTRGVEVAPMFEPSDDVIVEWRGVTVGFLDRLCVEVNRTLSQELAGGELTLAQVLEAGSWKVCAYVLFILFCLFANMPSGWS